MISLADASELARRHTAIRAQMTVTDLAEARAPHLTMSQGPRLAAQAFTREVSPLPCCAA